jgi:uncharacterized protein (TIGR02453 family)
MSFSHLYDFLERLQANNHKAWMDANRKEYHTVRDFFVQWLDEMNDRLAAIDPDYFDTPGKKAINRINNNLLYHPGRPVYKDHFGAGLDQVSKQGDFYIELGVNESFIGGGYWHPSSKALRSLREAIDYNGDELQAILDKPSFKRMFQVVDPESLKRPPKGFTEDHPHIGLLKRRNFAALRPFSREEVCGDGFKKQVVSAYKELTPFRRYLNQAISV